TGRPRGTPLQAKSKIGLMSVSRGVSLLLVFCSANFCADGVESLSYNEHIRPILSENCFACHGKDASGRKGDRRLDTSEGATAERDGIRAIVPGDLDESDAWIRITSDDPEEVMPPPDSHKNPL